ncbi:hypothetical protein H7169_00195 [Candidatus Gracilibacteria bacterium]|nr:hypothetical protein [Candidatus Gracilibacteria bacterium]
MSLNLSSGVSETPEPTKLGAEAQSRINHVTTSALAILEGSLDTALAVKKLFGTMVSDNLRNPENIAKIQDGLYEARDVRLAKANPNERLAILESFSEFMKNFTEGIALMNRDIGLSNQAHVLANASDAKMNQVRSTYQQILANTHPTHTA